MKNNDFFKNSKGVYKENKYGMKTTFNEKIVTVREWMSRMKQKNAANNYA